MADTGRDDEHENPLPHRGRQRPHAEGAGGTEGPGEDGNRRPYPTGRRGQDCPREHIGKEDRRDVEETGIRLHQLLDIKL